MKTTFNFADDTTSFKRNVRRLGSNIILQGVHDYRKYCGFIKNAKYFDIDCQKYYKQIIEIRNFANTELFDSLKLMSKEVYLEGLKKIELNIYGNTIDNFISEKHHNLW